jgi:hypothetical protein
VTDRVAYIGTEEAESVDRAVAKIRMREIDACAHDANPNMFALQSKTPEL